ncbi:hypothetical protein [Clostridium sardiniense]|uniref:hypothetical protein n=1 Tax=Clostridium sardiniense TaxID=29369 RepID=UPI00195EE708|nr:hypothetical protein [Clostridium sardiniense]MBM7835571.1 hypothetical protein [Clostridium sardiniense]
MTNNQKKIVKYLKKTLKLDSKELILDYDDNSVVVIDNIANFVMILHFIYMDSTIILISDKDKYL